MKVFKSPLLILLSLGLAFFSLVQLRKLQWGSTRQSGGTKSHISDEFKPSRVSKGIACESLAKVCKTKKQFISSKVPDLSYTNFIIPTFIATLVFLLSIILLQGFMELPLNTPITQKVISRN